MGTVRPTVLALFAFLLVLWTLFAPAVGQGSAGHLAVTTDYQLFGTSDLSGGGHVTWDLTGAKAADLRAKIIHMFDEYAQIPRGFPFEGAVTPANGDGTLEPTEGLRYTDLLENVLEGAPGGQGTSIQYLNLYPFDLREKNDADPPLGFVRSTAGLANTNLSTSADVEIRFLFEANTTTRDARFRLPTNAFADALYAVFSYEGAQAPNINASGPWPFLEEGGWHIRTNVSGGPALWAGNLTTGLYDNNAVDLARTCEDPFLTLTCPNPSSTSPYVPFDLRFASRASVTFRYRGQVADPGDRLRLEVAHPPAFTDWAPLPFGAQFDIPATNGAWVNASIDLTRFLGQQVRLRWNFTSDGSGNGPGFFIRDFALHAPAFYEGDLIETDSHYLVGTLSFSDPALPTGGMNLIRTPGGEVLFYSSTWNASTIPDDTIAFRTFSYAENPQILFVVMLASSYAISRLQEAAYDRYREAHPSEYRPAVPKAKWLHRIGLVAIAILILFYFVPTATWFVGLRVFVSGPAYWSLAIALPIVLGFGTRVYYGRQLTETPPPVEDDDRVFVKKVAIPTIPLPSEGARSVAACTQCLREIREGDPTYRCTCGSAFHLACAKGLTRCPNCRTPIAVGVVGESRPASLRCESCGEPQTVPEGTDPRAATCMKCGGHLRHLDEGKRYLIVASNPTTAFGWLRDLTKGGKPALCVTPAAPERLRLEFGLQGVNFIQASAQASGGVDPKKLDPTGLKAILPLVRQRKGGVILYDGLDQIVAQASMGDVIRFLRKANDMAFVHGVTVIARVGPGVLADAELRRLNAEFDEFLDLSAQL